MDLQTTVKSSLCITEPMQTTQRTKVAAINNSHFITVFVLDCTPIKKSKGNLCYLIRPNTCKSAPHDLHT